MKIETASLQHGAPIRRVVFDDAGQQPAPPPQAPRNYGAWAWAAALARYAFGDDDTQRDETTPQEIETR